MTDIDPARAVADSLLRELAGVDPEAAEALGEQPDNVMPAFGPQDFARRRAAYESVVRALDADPGPPSVLS
ncbi:MAG: hypothetical protein ABI345_06310, partial [Jatrophihabitans sp.]